VSSCRYVWVRRIRSNGGTIRDMLQLLREWLWPVRPRAPWARLDRDDYLRPIIVLMIVLLCGPEVVAAADLVLLLDLIGAVLFLTAFVAGYRALGLAALTAVQRILFPSEWVFLIRMRGHPRAMAHGLALVGRNALLVSALCLVAVACVVATVASP
jgi:hypothetical protein